MTNHVYIVFLCTIGTMFSFQTIKLEKVPCKRLPEVELEEVLGSAFNARYMSIDVPSEETTEGRKRNIGYAHDFFVDSQHQDDLGEKPAWIVKNHVEATRNTFEMNRGGKYREKRGVSYMLEEHCESKINWTDLGPDYFPRYLRSVECLPKNCWLSPYKCRTRSFAAKILRRKRNKCVPGPGEKIGVSGLPKELRELWVWEERAVGFCCECHWET